MRSLVSLAFGAALLVGFAPSAHAQPFEPQVVPSQHHSTSVPIREMESRPHIYRNQGPYVIPNRFPYRFDSLPVPEMRPDLVDPVLDAPPPGALRTGGITSGGLLLSDFEGIPDANSAPPDPTGEIGPNHYVQMVNSRTAVYDRSGALLLGPINNNTFWQDAGGLCEVNNDGDPVVLYDETVDRWLISQFVSATGPDAICVAISATSDPTGAYHRYEFGWPEGFPDYPKFGVWPTGYALTTSTFPDGASAFSQAVMLERDEMLLGNPARSIRFNFPTGEYYSMLPADFDGPAPPDGAPALFAGLRLSSSSPAAREVVRLYALTPDWTTPSNSTFTSIENLPVAPYDVYALFQRDQAIPQAGTSDRVAALGHRPMMQLKYRNRGTHQTMLFNHTIAVNDGPTTRTGVRWYELRNDEDSGDWSVYQQGTYAPDDGHFRWVGSMAMNDDGDIGLAYSVSSSALHPSLRFTGQTADASGTGMMNVAEAEILNGTGSQIGTANRWGDYSHLSVDPTDGTSFWFTSLYYQTTGAFDWKTRVAHIEIGVDLPAFAVGSDAISETILPDTMLDRDVTVSNTAAPGSAALSVSAVVQNLSQPGDMPVGTRLSDGGPDAFGYVWEDSKAPGGPAFDWVDISGASATPGTVVDLDNDEGSPVIDLPFTFSFYGLERTSLSIGSNGFLSFSRQSLASADNQNLPDSGRPNNLIAMYWDDLNPALGGDIRYRDMEDGRFIVQFTDVPHAGSASETSTFQAILHSDGQIDLQYLSMTDDASDPNSYTIGIENQIGTVGLPVAFDEPYVEDNLRVRFNTTSIWASLAQATLTVASGTSESFTLTLDGTDLPEGVYTGELVLTTNDPEAFSTTIPITLTVSSTVAEEAGPDDGLVLGAPFPNPSRELARVPFTLTEPGSVRLSVIDALGREVAVLADGDRGAGNHAATLDSSRLGVGMYMIRLAAGGQVLTQRVSVVR